MQVKTITIRKPDWNDPDKTVPFVGIIEVAGESGAMKIRLGSKTISQIFKLATTEAIAVAAANARSVEGAMNEAVHGPLLADASNVQIS